MRRDAWSFVHASLFSARENTDFVDEECRRGKVCRIGTLHLPASLSFWHCRGGINWQIHANFRSRVGSCSRKSGDIKANLNNKLVVPVANGALLQGEEANAIICRFRLMVRAIVVECVSLFTKLCSIFLVVQADIPCMPKSCWNPPQCSAHPSKGEMSDMGMGLFWIGIHKALSFHVATSKPAALDLCLLQKPWVMVFSQFQVF